MLGFMPTEERLGPHAPAVTLGLARASASDRKRAPALLAHLNLFSYARRTRFLHWGITLNVSMKRRFARGRLASLRSAKVRWKGLA